MSEQYHNNVAALAKRMHAPNPVKEDDVEIASLIFFKGRRQIPILGTSRNTAGRLFFEEHCTLKDGDRIVNFNITDEFLLIARRHFAELWDDAEIQGRSLIMALKQADRVVVTWKK